MGYFSNGTEAEMYEERFCSRCVHTDLHAIGETPPCAVWWAHSMFAYEECNNASNAKEILDMLIPRTEDGIGNDECKMFVPRDVGAAIEGQTALEVDT